MTIYRTHGNHYAKYRNFTLNSTETVLFYKVSAPEIYVVFYAVNWLLGLVVNISHNSLSIDRFFGLVSFTLSCIMPKNDQIHLKNLAVDF